MFQSVASLELLPAVSKLSYAVLHLGGALALYTALRFPTAPLGGCVALSTWLPLRTDFPAALSQFSTALPVLQVHGTKDRVVGFHWGEQSSRSLAGMIKSPAPRFVPIEVLTRIMPNICSSNLMGLLCSRTWVIIQITMK